MYSVAGVERYPLKVHKSMGAKLIERRSKVKPFIKVSDYVLKNDNLEIFIDLLYLEH